MTTPGAGHLSLDHGVGDSPGHCENVETLVELRKHALSKAQQYHLKLMSRMRVVATLESHLNHQEDPVEIRHLKQELNALKKK